MTAIVAVNYSAPVSSVAGTVTAGQCLVSSGTAGFVVATAANRTTYGRADGIAFNTGDQKSPVVMILIGPVPASVTLLGTGLAGPIRVSSAGVLERVATPSSSDEVVGYCETDGRAHVAFGVLTHRVYVDSGGGGGSFTAAGDLSGDETTQIVEKVKGTTITTAGGALAVGAVLRTTAVGTADWGAVNLADTDAVTGTLPKGNQASQDMAGDVTGTTAASVVSKVNGISCSGTPAAGAVLRATSSSAAAWGQLDLADTDAVTGVLPTGNVATTLTGKTLTTATIDADQNTITNIENADIKAGAAIAISKLAAIAASDIASGTLIHERGGLEADVSAYDGLVRITGGATSAVAVSAAFLTWLATPSSANFASLVTGETGSGALVFGTSPTIATPSLGSPSITGVPNITTFTTNGSTGTLNDVSRSSSAIVEFTHATGPTVNGFDATGAVDGTLVGVYISGGNVLIAHEDAGSSAANRFTLSSGINITCTTGSITWFIYRTSRWRALTASAI